MGPKYFNGLNWQQITREERVFCAELEFCIRNDPEFFIKLLQREANLPRDLRGPWHSAYEVCFYRDYLHRFRPKDKGSYSAKRTFDIALFSDEAIVIIEAKAAEVFTADQARYFDKDCADLQKLLGPAVQVYLVALGSRTYFDNYKQIGRGTALEPFENRYLTWEAVAQWYPENPLLERACHVYERSPLAIVDSDSVPYWREAGDVEAEIGRLKEEIAQRERAVELLRGKRPV